MKRREFMGLIGGAAMLPMAARAQQPKVYRVGFLMGPSAESTASLFHALREGLRERGYVEERNFTFLQRYADGRIDRLPELAAELVRLKVDVIVTGSNLHVEAARQATSTIPIVMIYAADPVGAGFVASLARPGGNITGLASDASHEQWAKFISLLTEVVPNLSRVGVIGRVSTRVEFAELDTVSRMLNVSFEVADLQRPEDLDSAFETIVNRRVEALLVVGSPLVYFLRQRIADAALKHRLPGIINVRQFVQAGLLMSYGPNLEEQYRRAAVYIDKIINGALPADLPVEQPTKFELVINLKTARAIRLKVPESFLLRADEVIE